MTKDTPTIYIVDDDASVRKSLTRLMKSVGLKTEAFASASDYLSFYPHAKPCCLLLDVQMPGMSGLDLQKLLITLNHVIPIIFITAYEDKQTYNAAMKAGALAVLQKPFDDHALLDVISIGVAKAIP